MSHTLERWYVYRPQRSCGQGYVFTRVCDSVHRVGVSVQTPLAGRTPPGTRQTPPPGPSSRPPPRDQADTPPDQADTPPGPGRHPPSIRSMSGRYASYWNAFLWDFYLLLIIFYLNICCNKHKIREVSWFVHDNRKRTVIFIIREWAVQYGILKLVIVVHRLCYVLYTDY